MICRKHINFNLLKDSINIKRMPLVLYMVLIIFVPNLFMSLFGVSFYESINFTFYILIYQGLNGYLLYSLISRHIPNEIAIPSILVLGMSYNILTFFLFSLFGLQKYSYLNLFISLILLLKSQHKITHTIEFSYKEIFQNFLVMGFCIIVIFPSCSNFLFTTVVNHHFTIQGLTAATLLKNSYPYVHPLFKEIPLFYNYGYHTEMAFCNLITSLSIEILCSRLYPFYTLFLLTYFIYSFTRFFFEGKNISGLLALVCIFSVPDFTSISCVWFLNAIPLSAYLVGSTTLGLLIFLIIISLVYSYITNNNNLKIMDYFFFFCLVYVGAMSRSALVPVLLGGLFFYALIDICLRHRRLLTAESKLMAILLILGGFSFSLSLIVVYGVLSNYSATGFMYYIGKQNAYFDSTISTLLNDKTVLRYRIIALIHIFLMAGFLTVGFYYRIYKWFRLGINNLDLLLLCLAFASLIIWNYTMAPGGSHYTFLHYGQIIFMIFGATGTYLLFKDLFRKNNYSLYMVALLSISFIPVKVYEIYNWARSFHFNSLSFLRHPNWSALSQETIEKISQIVNANDNNIFISLMSLSASDHHVIGMHIKNSYQLGHLHYLRRSLIKNPESLERITKLSNKFEAIIKKKILTQEDINNFKILFPRKQLFFVSFDKQIPFDADVQGQINIITPGLKILTP